MSRTVFTSLVVALFITAVTMSGCSNDVVLFEGECPALCVEGVPTGPAANLASCIEWGEEFRCLVIDLLFEGSCEEPNIATCAVTDCEFVPECQPQ